ncbi:phosphotransferase [Yinghuangia sp. ASG 101]|uniref:phosphotransferase enzyme family protein n=1 Tax=Yinghuangia sp. ASG 101 TaxID=2896848 RepID=UPI001E50381A|nr:phosphotransferase [Yinghuangia sp. ASG 101]UGQ14310.1 phosphotransferase [Yinghuangia sp. ASG 101]
MRDEMESTRAPFTARMAEEVLHVACAAVGLKAAGAVLVRLGENAVFRLGDPVIVRVARPTTPLSDVARTAAVARWLADTAYPAARLLPDVEQPIVVRGSAVTFWHRAAETDRYASPAQLGELLRHLHALEAPPSLGLPVADVLGSVFRWLPRLDELAPDDRDFLRDRAYMLQDRYDDLDFALAFGVLHGDAHVRNALADPAGQAHLIDLDDVAEGPREWDLTVTAVCADRLGWHTRAEYRRFADAYGFDVTTWDGYPVLADIHELMMVAWLAQSAADNPAATDELTRRIADLRSGSTRRAWRPF